MLDIKITYRLDINLKHENKQSSREELKEPSCNSHIWLAGAMKFTWPQRALNASRMGQSSSFSQQIWQPTNTGPQICDKACTSFWSVVSIHGMPLKMATTSALEKNTQVRDCETLYWKNTHGGIQELWMQTFKSWRTMNIKFSIIVVLGSFSF